jgi:hypothetical protein
MTGAELIEEVQHIVQDSSYDDDRILAYLNEGLAAVASRVDMPEFEALNDIDTIGIDSVALPSDYMRDVKSVYSVTNKLQISQPGRSTEYLKFRRRNPTPDSGGGVTDVGVRANTLYYFPTPTQPETLRVTYFRHPLPFTGYTVPEGIPLHLQRRILCSYASWVIYSQIEDGIEGQKINTNDQWAQHITALSELVD